MDADNHYYEPHDCFTRHIEPKYADHAIRVVPGADGLGRLFVGDERMGYTSVTPFDYMGAPGSQQRFFEGKEGTDGWRQYEVIQPSKYPYMFDRDARLGRMDEQGIEACVMFPTLGVHWEPELTPPGVVCANMRAFNRWLEDDWGYGYQNRIFGVALLSLIDVDEAVAELRRVLEKGARLIGLRAGPVAGRSPADPEFDPFWSLVNEARIPVILHTGNFGYSSWFGVQWSEEPHPRLHEMSGFQWATCQNERPVADTLTAMIMHNLFGRYPNVRVLTVENGSMWIEPLLSVLDKAAKMAGRGPWLGGPITAKPSELFRQHIYISPFYEDDIAHLVDVVGADQILFGSDYPHPEGLEHPVEYVDRLKTLDAADIRKIMRGNAAGLIGLAA